MAQSAIQELNAILQSLQSLKPPGVGKSKVEAATRLCMDLQNIPIEPQLVESLIAAFHKSPISHKLGVLYIVDSIMRQWVVTGAAHAGGVRRMTDNLPMLMNDYIPLVPDSQKDRLSKLFDIWIASKTFPTAMLQGFKNRLHDPAPATPQTVQQVHTQLPAHGLDKLESSNINPQDQASLLAALAAPPQAAPPPQYQVSSPAPPPQVQHQHQPQASIPAPVPDNAMANALLAALANVNQPQTTLSQASNQASMNYPPSKSMSTYQSQPSLLAQQQVPQAATAQYGVPQQQTPQQQQIQQPSAANIGALSALLPNAQAGAQAPNALMNQLQLLQTLSQQLGPDQLQTLLQALVMQQQPQSGAVSNTPHQSSLAPTQTQNVNPYAAPINHGNGYASQSGQSWGSRNDAPPGARERSKSPDWNRGHQSPPNRRASPTYGSYNPYGDDRGRGAGRNDYRQRSPPATNSPNLQGGQPKPVGFDNSLPEGTIKVLSRTLFVGGVKTTEPELKAFFSQFGGVQSCIVNHDKRHAFLKMITHQDTQTTRQAVWNLPESDYRSLFERVNWAVGFGPTHCADYNLGCSIVPLDLLTDADRKWLLTAQLGGTGGLPITPGMIVEEPDIEIGAGPSSKAIHRRGGGQQGRGGRRGGFQISTPDHGSNQQRYQARQNRHETSDANNYGPPPSVPNFGGPLPGFQFGNMQR